MTAPVDDEQTVLLSRSVATTVNAYADRFRRSTAEEEGDEKDEDAGDDASA